MCRRLAAAIRLRRLCLCAVMCLGLTSPAFADDYVRVCHAEAHTSGEYDYLMMEVTAWVPPSASAQNTYMDYQDIEVSIGISVPVQTYDQTFYCTAKLWIHDGYYDWILIATDTYSETLPGVPGPQARLTLPEFRPAGALARTSGISPADASLPRHATDRIGRDAQPAEQVRGFLG
jgi:hypothetical protein